MVKLCVFDLDGTLVNTLGDLADSLNHALVACGALPLCEQDVSAIVGHSVAYMCQNALPEGRRDEWKNVYECFMAYYGAHLSDKSRPYEGVLPMLLALKRAGVTLAVATNKPHAHAMKVLSALFPRDLFSIILGRMDKFSLKPAPDALLFVLDYFDVAKADAVYVGDSEVDVAFAKNAGLPCISVSWGLRTRDQLVAAGATRILDDPLEIAEIVLNAKP